MPFQEPSIHRVRSIKARTVAPDDADFVCLNLTLTDRDGVESEVEVYFNSPHQGRAFEYADAINGVPAISNSEDVPDEK